MSNFFFCHYVFKKLSAAEASESVYMRERVKNETCIPYHCDTFKPVPDTIRTYDDDPEADDNETIVGKGEILKKKNFSYHVFNAVSWLLPRYSIKLPKKLTSQIINNS